MKPGTLAHFEALAAATSAAVRELARPVLRDEHGRPVMYLDTAEAWLLQEWPPMR